MATFVESSEFKALNVTFALDEGGLILNDEGVLYVFCGERTMLQIELIFHGQSGHGARLFANSPGEKLNYVVGKFMELRKEELRKFSELKYSYGNLTSINLTILKGGVLRNVVPAEMSATFDIRLAVQVDVDEFIQMVFILYYLRIVLIENMLKFGVSSYNFSYQKIENWCNDAGGNITINYLDRGVKGGITKTDDTNPFWVAFKKATDES